jgi:tRNA(fMet)-specific endonuclease VapC
VTRYLLDTNILSDLIRNPQGRIAARIAEVDERTICTSIIVAAELRYRAARRGSARLTVQLEKVLGAIEVLPFEAPAEQTYGDLRCRLESAGTPIGANDLLIAAHALALGYVLVSDNVREFSRVEDLELENWLREN